MRKVIVDTDIIIDYLRQPHQVTLFRKLTQDRNLKILLPAVCLTELYSGKSSAESGEERRLQNAVKKTNSIKPILRRSLA